MAFVVLCPGAPEGSTGSGSGFQASQKTGPQLKVSSDRLVEAGNRTCDPWFTRHTCRFILYTTAVSDVCCDWSFKGLIIYCMEIMHVLYIFSIWQNVVVLAMEQLRYYKCRNLDPEITNQVGFLQI